MKSVFITGSAGFIGTYTVGEFINRGYFVFALIHKNISDELVQFEKNGNLSIIRGSITDFENIKKSLEQEMRGRNQKLDIIVHCAGRASDIGWKSEFRKTNFEAVKKIVSLAEYFNVERFVFLSTTDVYGMKDFHGESEDRLILENNTGNYYPEFKILAEKWVGEKLPAEKSCIIRLAQVWGIGDTTLTSRIVDFLRISPWIVHFGKWQGKNRWPLAHVRNVAAAIYFTAVSPDAAGQIFNIVDNEVTSIDEFYRIVGKIYLPGKNFRSIILPFWIGYLIGWIVSHVSNILNLNRPFVDPSLYALYSVSKNLDFSNRKLAELFKKHNYRPITREEGVEELIKLRMKPYFNSRVKKHFSE